MLPPPHPNPESEKCIADKRPPVGRRYRPKLLVHVFIGSRLAKLAEEGDTMTAKDKAINYAGMLFGGVVGTVVALFIYRRTMARAAELEAEAVLAAQGEDGLVGGDEGGYEDADAEESRLMGAGVETDAAALMDEDDISLWGEGDGYTDGWGEEQGGVDEGGKKQGIVAHQTASK